MFYFEWIHNRKIEIEEKLIIISTDTYILLLNHYIVTSNKELIKINNSNNRIMIDILIQIHKLS